LEDKMKHQVVRVRAEYLRHVLAVILLIVVGACSKAENSSPTLRIGAILPQTGAGAPFAQYIQKGLDLAVKEINAKHPGSVELRYADSRSDPKEAGTAFQQMVLVDNPPVVIAALSSVTKVLAPRAKPSNTVLVGTAVSLPGVTDASDFVFRVYPVASGVAGIIAPYAVQKYRTAAVAYITDDFGKSCADVFRATFETGGGSVLAMEPFNPGEKDFRVQWGRIRDMDPDCVWVVGYGPAYSVVLTQMKEAGMRADLLADMTLGLPTTQKNVGEGAEGVVYVDGPMDDDFVKRYESEYGEIPTSYAGYAYDIVMMIDSVFRDRGSAPDDIRTGLQSIRGFPGVMGPVTILDNRDAALQLVLMKIVNGKPTRLRQ